VTLGFWERYVLALVVLGLLLLGLSVIARALARGRVVASASRRLVTVIESTVVGPGTALHVVKAARRYFIVGGGSGHLAMLAELPADDVETWLAEQRSLLSDHAGPLFAAVRRLRGRR
jgi:flagellar biogenesis protein FliO